MRDKIKQDILSCLEQDTSNFGITVKDIALKIDYRDIRIVQDLVQELYSEGKIIEKSYSAGHNKKYKVSKTGQDLLGN